MKSRIFVVLVVFATILQSGLGIKCYNCISDENTKCLNPKDSGLEATDCTPEVLKKGADLVNSLGSQLDKFFEIDIYNSKPAVIPNMVCQKLQIAVVGRSMNTTIRSCQIGDGNLNICDKMKTKLDSDQRKILYCGTCGTDGCNSGPRQASILTFQSIIGLIVLSNFVLIKLFSA